MEKTKLQASELSTYWFVCYLITPSQCKIQISLWKDDYVQWCDEVGIEIVTTSCRWEMKLQRNNGRLFHATPNCTNQLTTC